MILKKNCLMCGAEYPVPRHRMNKSLYCSKSCQHKSMVGIPLSDEHRKNVSEAVKRNLPSTAFKKGQKALNKGSYKENVGYSAIHKWVYTQAGKAKVCSICGSTKCVNWANISGEYKRDMSDFRELCRACHNCFDYGQSKKLVYRDKKSWRPEISTYKGLFHT